MYCNRWKKSDLRNAVWTHLHFRLQNRVVSKLEVCTSSDRITTTSPDGVVTSLTNPVSDFCDIKGLQHHKWPPHLVENSQPDFDVGVVASFGKMLTSKIISSFPQWVSHQQLVRLQQPLFLATCRTLTGFGNAENWVFCLSFLKIEFFGKKILCYPSKSR